MKKEIKEQSILYRDVPIARSGIYKYLGDELGLEPKNKIFNVLRHPDDYSQDFLDSLELLPLLDDHHDGKEGASKNKIGAVGGRAWKDPDGKIRTNISIFDSDAEEKIKNGKKELSIGFSAKNILERGVYDGQTYEIRQIPMAAEHVALVDHARAGKDIRLHDQTPKVAEGFFYDSFKFYDEESMGEAQKPVEMSDILTAINSIKGMFEVLASKLDNNNAAMDDGDELMAGADLSIIDPQKVGELAAQTIVANMPETVEMVVEQSIGEDIDMPDQAKQAIEEAASGMSNEIASAVSSSIETMQAVEGQQDMTTEDQNKLKDAAIKQLRHEEKIKEQILKDMKDCGFDFCLSAGESLSETANRAKEKFMQATKIKIRDNASITDVLYGYRIHYRQKASEAVKVSDSVKQKDQKEKTENVFSNLFNEEI
jgi:Uncharacterized protein conserved in bacteria (DUF2213)